MDADELVHAYLGLAQSLAKQVWRTAPHALELDELTAIAYEGLVKAAQRWHPYCRENDYSPDALQFFKPFVVFRVRGALIDAIRSVDWAGRSLRNRAKKLAEAGGDRGLSVAQLAVATGMSETEVRNTQRDMTHRVVSADSDDCELRASTDVESSVFTRGLLRVVVQTVQALPFDQQAVIALHYHSGMKLQEVAAAMGITDSRASGLHAKAVLAIHEALADAAGSAA